MIVKPMFGQLGHRGNTRRGRGHSRSGYRGNCAGRWDVGDDQVQPARERTSARDARPSTVGAGWYWLICIMLRSAPIDWPEALKGALRGVGPVAATPLGIGLATGQIGGQHRDPVAEGVARFVVDRHRAPSPVPPGPHRLSPRSTGSCPGAGQAASTTSLSGRAGRSAPRSRAVAASLDGLDAGASGTLSRLQAPVRRHHQVPRHLGARWAGVQTVTTPEPDRPLIGGPFLRGGDRRPRRAGQLGRLGHPLDDALDQQLDRGRCRLADATARARRRTARG